MLFTMQLIVAKHFLKILTVEKTKKHRLRTFVLKGQTSLAHLRYIQNQLVSKDFVCFRGH